MAQYSKEQKQTLAAYAWWGETPNGKLVLEDLAKNSHERLSHVKGDPYQTAYNEGRRSMYLDIMSAVKEGIRYGSSSKRDAAGSTGADDRLFDEPAE